MLRLFDRHDWRFLEELTEGYGSVVKIHDIFGVGSIAISYTIRR